jgi:hypothetical protein
MVHFSIEIIHRRLSFGFPELRMNFRPVEPMDFNRSAG